MACKYYRKAPTCTSCGGLTYILNQEERRCEACGIITPLTAEEKEYVMNLPKMFKIPPKT